jgi:hypothetical protein
MLPLRIVIDVGSDVPGWPFTNPPVADAFMAKILFDLGATFLAPVFFDRGIVVIGHKMVPWEAHVGEHCGPTEAGHYVRRSPNQQGKRHRDQTEARHK